MVASTAPNKENKKGSLIRSLNLAIYFFSTAYFQVPYSGVVTSLSSNS